MASSHGMQGKRRALIWGGLLVLLAGSVGLLLMAKQNQADRGDDGWELSGGEPQGPQIQLHIVDETGRSVPNARVWVVQDPNLPPSQWNEATATLTLPQKAEGTEVFVQCRGFRSLDLKGVTESQEVVLSRGLVIRVIVGGRPVLPGLPYRLYFQVRPGAEAWAHLNEQEQDALVSLMDSLRAPPPDVKPSTRESFGYEVSQDQAEGGVLIPMPGTYDLRWGLLDVERQLWYSRKDGTVTTIDVKDQQTPQLYEVPITTEEIDATRLELDAIER